ncbi:MAG: hypothetical protein ABIQ30_12140 [Devosia sp.]
MRTISALVLAAAMLPSASFGASLVSAYTDLNLDKCKLVQSDEVGGTWACKGLNGYPLVVAEGDLRMTVSYGKNARDEVAMSQGFAPFNHLGTKIEWLNPANTAKKPVATILRWYLQQGEGPGESQILVVTQLKPGAVCQIAWIDATANKNANELARRAATELAGDFDCEGMPQIYGEFEAFEIE